jgi:hypothetical protein
MAGPAASAKVRPTAIRSPGREATGALTRDDARNPYELEARRAAADAPASGS